MKTKLAIISACLTLSLGIAHGQEEQFATTKSHFGYTPVAEVALLEPKYGNAVRVVNDLSVAGVSDIGLNWTRYHNSQGGYFSEYGGLTPGFSESAVRWANWTHSFSWALSIPYVGECCAIYINVAYPDGSIRVFQANFGDTKFVSLRNADYLEKSGSTYTLITADNRRITFPLGTAKEGYASSIRDAKGNVTGLSYVTHTSVRVLSRVTDPSGHYLQLNYTPLTNSNSQGNYSSPYLASVVASDGRSVTYSYTKRTLTGGASGTTHFLTGATYSDFTSASYSYDSNAFPRLSSADDVRAEGVPKIRYEYAPPGYGFGEPGYVQKIWNNADQTLIVQATIELNLPANSYNSHLSYPDGRVYDYTQVASADPRTNTYRATNSISGTTKYVYKAPANYNYETGTWVITVTDAKGGIWTGTRTPRGHLLSKTAPGGATATHAYDELGYLISSTDENQNTTSYTRDPINRWVMLIRYADTSTESFTYNTFGQVLTHTRRNGGVESFTYTSDGLLSTRTSATGELTRYAYNANYRIASVTDGNNNTTSYEYNDRGQITKVTNADQSFRTFSYDILGNLVRETNELGKSGTYTYDSFNRVLTSTDPLGRKIFYTFNPLTPGNKSPTSVLSPSGRRAEATYQSAFGHQMSSLTLGHGTPLATTFSQSFDILGNVTVVAPPTGNPLTFNYDARNRKIKTTDPAGNVTTFSYDPVGNLLSQTNAGGSTVNTYDSRNRVITSVYPAASPSASPDPVSVSYTYDAEDAIKTYTDPNKNVYRYDYDLEQRQTRAIFPDATSHQRIYDPVGNLTAFIARDGRIKTFEYDNRNRCTSHSWNDGVTAGASKTYDVASRVTSITNASSSITYTYDVADDPIKEVQYIFGLGGKTVQYSYSVEGELETMTYPDGTVVGYRRDALGNLTDVLSGGINGTSVVHYTYDAFGNRTGKNLGNGVNTVLTYDAAQRLASLADTAPASGGGGLLQTFNYGYDTLSRLKYVKRTNGLGDVYGYDNRNQLTGVQYNAADPDSAPVNPSRSVSYIFDAAGNRNQTIDSVAGTTNYVSNSNNQYTSVGGNPLTYDTLGNTATFSGLTYAYDAENRLVSAMSGQPGTVEHRRNPGDTSPEIIPTGAISVAIDVYGPGGYVPDDVNTGAGGGAYSGKTLGLAAADWGVSIPYSVTASNSHPNVSTIGPISLSAGSLNMSAGGGNSLGNGGVATGGDTNQTGGTRKGSTGGSGAGPGGGAGGLPGQAGATPGGGGGGAIPPARTPRLGGNGLIVFKYTIPSAPAATFEYDAYGRCVRRTDGSGTTYLVYGRGWHVIAEYNVSGIQQGRYIQGTLPDEILTRTDSSGTTVYYHTDHLGSVTKLTLATGQLAEDYSYDVYGKTTIRNASGTTLAGSGYGNRFMFTGREYFSSLQLYDYRNRVYSAELGRFLQPDPVGHEGDLFNLYRYAGNNPGNKIDPSGLSDYWFYMNPQYDSSGALVAYDEAWTYVDDAGNTYSATSSWRAPTATSDPPSVHPEQSTYSYRETRREPQQTAAQAPAPAPAPVAAVFDARSERILAQLQPQVAALARQHLTAIHAAGINAQIISGFRTYEEQDRLYSQGRPGGPQGNIVTDARGGESNHNFGVAYDIGISRDGWRTLLNDGPEYTRAGELGTTLGLEWGGSWQRRRDRPHFQFTGGQTTRQLRQRFEAGLPVLP